MKDQHGLIKGMRVAVPRCFIASRDANGQRYVQFLAPPYTADRISVLHKILSDNTQAAPDEWPLFKCQVFSAHGQYTFSFFG